MGKTSKTTACGTDAEAASVGVVHTQQAAIALPAGGLRLERGGVLPELTVAYETYGTLSPSRDNVIYICHALTGDAHAAGCYERPGNQPGWWDDMIGPGKGIDTRYYFVVCGNILGGCRGTTGPASANPATGRPYGSAFPEITVGDMVTVHTLLLRHLGIERLAGLIGGSLGGMQVLEWTVRYPDTVDRAVCIASAASLCAQTLAFDVVARKAITSDPDWQGGDFYGTGRAPRRGLAQARRIGHITYLSPEIMDAKFGRERRQPAPGATGGPVRPPDFASDFQVESYLDHQGEKLVKRFDANSYLYITHAMDEYDLQAGFASLEESLRRVKAQFLVVALSSDWLFPPEQSMALADALLRAGRRVSYCKLQAPHGHDAFLVDIEHLAEVVRAFLPWISKTSSQATHMPDECPRCAGLPPDQKRQCAEEIRQIASLVASNARVLDLGCGDGHLLSVLRGHRGVSGLGVDIAIGSVIDVIDKGHDIFQGDIDEGLAMIADGAYDVAILSETLQVVRKPREVLREVLRVARAGIVSFPNFAKWTFRAQLGFGGRMPKGSALPFEWYNTPNIHLFTLRDFCNLCRDEGIRVESLTCISGGAFGSLLVRLGLRNLGADRVLVKIVRDEAAAPRRAGGTPP